MHCITPRTRAVIVVDLGGFSPDISSIRALLAGKDIKIIVDSAQSFGSIGKEGTDYGDVGVYSFQKSKNLTCGEGGALVTDDEALYRLAYSLHNCGRDLNSKWYEHKYNGSNHRMSELCACLTVSQLRNFERQAELRAQNAEFIIGGLRDSKVFKALQTDASIILFPSILTPRSARPKMRCGISGARGSPSFPPMKNPAICRKPS